MSVTTSEATVYHGGGRRWFTRRAAERAAAKAIIKQRCDCCASTYLGGDYVEPGNICIYHSDPARLQRMIHLLVVMFIRKDRT